MGSTRTTEEPDSGGIDKSMSRESRKLFLSEFRRRLVLLSREVEGLRGRAEPSEEDETAVGAGTLLAGIAGLQRELDQGRILNESDAAAAMERIRATWATLRASFEDLAVRQGRRYRTDRGRQGSGPRR